MIAITLFLTMPLAQHINGGLLAAGITSGPATVKADKKLQVLLITSSGLHCALNNVDKGNPQSATDIKSIYLPLASIWSFGDIQSTLEKANPDIIVLQSSVLANNSKTSNSRMRLRHLKRYWITKLSLLHPLIERTLINLQCALNSLDHDDWNRWLDIGVLNKTLRTENVPEQVEFLQRLASLQKPVIIINQPQPSRAHSFKRVVDESVNHIVSNAGDINSIIQINYTTVHPDSSFYDPYHPKPELSSVFNRWFNKEINRLIKQ